MDRKFEIITADKDVNLFYVEADSFPEGIGDAWNKLHTLLKYIKGRKFYGISHGTPDGKISYKAAVEELYPGEAEKYGCKTFIFKKGNYKSTTIKDFMNILGEIAKVFSELKNEPDIDPIGYCAEIYKDDSEVRCMIKLNN